MSNKWTEKDLKILKENYANMNDEELHELIQNHSVTSISTKRRRLGFHRTNKKYSFDDVLKEIAKTDYILLSSEDEYDTCHSQMRYICPKHKDKGELITTLSNLLEGKGCFYCGRETAALKNKKEIDVEFYKKRCEELDFTFIEVIYDNMNYISFYCNKHKELGPQRKRIYDFDKDIDGCKYCLNKDLPEWYVKEQIAKINPTIHLTEEYKGFSEKHNCFCSKHNLPTIKTPSELLDGKGCVECGKEQLANYHFLSNEEVNKNIHIINPHVDVVQYNGCDESSVFICNKHNINFNKYYPTLLYHESGCEECYVERLRKDMGISQNEFEDRLREIHPELVVTGEYINYKTPVDVYCIKHSFSYQLTPPALFSRKSCCPKSKINYKEEQMCQILESWDFEIKRQKTFDECKDERLLPFDAYIIGTNVLLEYQGEQHYRPVTYSTQSYEDAVEKLKYTQKHDQIKRDFCKQNNMILIEVPYWEEDMQGYLFDRLVEKNVIELFD